MMSILGRIFSIVILFLIPAYSALAQTKTWVGATDNKWRTASNWSPVGVPDANSDVIINFIPGNNQCTLNNGSGNGICKSLTIGSGANATVFTENDGLFVYGDFTIGANGTFTDSGGNLQIEGNWTNNGTYTAGSSNRRVYFIGSNQTVGGTTVTEFEKLYINAGSTVTLAQNVIVSNFIELNGTLDPTPNFFINVGTNDINIRAGGELIVKAATYSGNYSAGSAQSITNTSVINYASTTTDQTIDPTVVYDILKISGSMTKSLSSNISVDRDLLIEGGTLDLKTFTANRNSSGGSLTLAALAALKIGGTNTFPTNYNSILLATNSTVNYYGANQTVQPLSYGHLTLSATGTATKTMPGTAFTVAGNFTSTTSAGTLSYTAGNSISVSGNINIGASNVFGGSTFSHSFGGNWTNEGTFNGCGGTLTSTGSGTVWSGAGVNNFGNLVVSGNGTVLHQNTSVSLCGNFSTTGGGSFRHTTGGTGTFTMTGSSKTISGSNIVLDDLIIDSGGSVTTTSTMVIAGDLTTTGSLSASAGTISLIGTSKTITGAGALQFAALNVPGSISTARSLSISSNFSIAGSYTATAGQTTFNGASTLSGTANIFNVNIAGGSSLIMGGSSSLGIAGTVINSGTFNATSNIPNTVNYNGTGAQTLVLSSFNNLILSNGNTKTPSSGLTVNGDLTIGAATTFVGSTFSHSLSGNWINNGVFMANTSTFTMSGSNDATMTGVSAFNNLTVNKGTGNKVTLNNNISAVNLNMNSGQMLTSSSSVTVTSTRTGNGIILGTITRTHAYTTGINYAFEGPDNFINFSNAGTVSSITVLIEKVIIPSFPSGAPVNRRYTISVAGAGYTATMRLHYEQVEVNGNAESAMTLWTDQGTGTWVDRSKSGNDTGANWVEQTGLTNIQNAWTISDGQNVIAWTGAVSTLWSNPLNWIAVSGSPGSTPTINDIVLLGDRIVVIPPTINTTAQAKGVIFNSVSAVALTIGSGSLTVQGNIEGDWSSDRTHTIIVGSNTITTFSDLELSDGVANRKIDITVSTGTINVTGSLFQRGGANITFTGAGTLNVGKDYNYVDGTFTPGTSTTKYNGSDDQIVANLTYNNLSIDKAFGVASTSGLTSINGDFNLSTSGGELDLGGTLNVVGNLTLTTGTTLNAQSSNINLGGNWSLGGTYIAGSGTVTFNGTGAQSVNQTTFNNLTVNKASGTLTFLGDLGVNGNIDVQAGTVDISTFTITRAVPGGLLTFGATAVVRAGGAVFQISNFTAFSAHPSSTVEFYGSSTRPIPPVIYGNLIISDAGAKIMIGPTTVAGNLTINTGATLVLPTSTLNLGGNLSNSGTLDASPGTLILNGTGKTISGGFTAKELIVNGEYNVVSGNHTINDNIEISTTGDLDLGTTTITVNGNMTNSGILFSSGIATFSGLQPQTIQLNNAISSTSTGVVNFNGTVAPILNSTSSPTLSTVNINNTASIVPSQPWVVSVAMTIASGATWDAGPFDHVMGGNFTNNGTVTSTGKITFNPNPPFPSVTVTLGNNFITTGTVDFSGTVPIILVDNTPTFNFVSITNTDASGITAATNWMVSQNLFIGPGSVFNGGIGLTHNVSGNWTNNGIFTGATSTIIFDSNAGTDEITGAGLNNFYNVTFDPGTSMEVVSDISIAQDFTNNATSLNLLSIAVTFTGTTLSAIGGATPSAFHELIINKSANGVRLDQNASVDNLLTLTSGLFDLNASTLSVTNSSAIAISRSTGYLLSENTMFNGRLSWSIGTDFDPHVVPFGNASADYIPFTFDLSSGDAGVVTLATYATPSNNLPLPPGVNHVKDVLGVDNSINTVDRFFLIELSGETTPTADITLSASAAEVGSITTLLGQRWNGIFWDTPLPGQLSGATSVTVPGVTQFSPWAISGNSTPLPITLLDFSAKQIDRRVALDWSTASEINNDYFEVEKSIDGVSFNAIGKVNGAINSTETRTYNFSDFELKKGRSFYRLKQIDLDKKFTYSPIVTVMVGEITTTNISFNVYPNPTVETLFITHTGVENNNVIVSIFNGSGTLISRSEQLVGLNDGPLELDVKGMKPGYYVVQAIAGGKSTSFRILKAE